MSQDEDDTREAQVREMLDKEIGEAWDWLLNDPKGLLILWSILDRCGLHSFPHYGNQMDTLHKGRQQIGAELLAEYVFPRGVTIYAQMLVDAEHRHQVLQQAIAETDAKNEEN